MIIHFLTPFYWSIQLRTMSPYENVFNDHQIQGTRLLVYYKQVDSKSFTIFIIVGTQSEDYWSPIMFFWVYDHNCSSVVQHNFFLQKQSTHCLMCMSILPFLEVPLQLIGYIWGKYDHFVFIPCLVSSKQDENASSESDYFTYPY